MLLWLRHLATLYVVLFYAQCYSSGNVLTPAEENEIESYISGFLSCKNVPGVGIAIVKDGKVYTRGFGLADIEGRRNFDADTIACGGSTGKFFTATLLAILMTEHNRRGKNMNWHTKLKDIPNLNMAFSDDLQTAEVTLLDLLTHRIGKATIDLLIISGFPDNIASRKKLSERIKYLPTVAPFREKFIYNNFMYMQAGYIAEVLGGAPYEDLIRDKIFNNINMTSGTFMEHLFEKPNHSLPYEDINGTLFLSDERVYKLKTVSPAGLICASSRDYAKWLQFLLQNATTPDGRKLVDRELWEEMWKGRQYIGDEWTEYSYNMYRPFPVSISTTWYATAWFGSNYRGHEKMVHTGGMHGYSAIAGVYRKKNMAYFINVNGPWPLPDPVIYPLSWLLDDILLNEERWFNSSFSCSFPLPWKNRTDDNDDEDPLPVYENITTESSKPYVGRYGHMLFGNIEVFYKNRTLMVNITALLSATLKYRVANDTFDLKLHAPYNNLFYDAKATMKFANKTGMLYNDITLKAWSETYHFNRGVDFNMDETSGQNCLHISLTGLVMLVGSILLVFYT